MENQQEIAFQRDMFLSIATNINLVFDRAGSAMKSHSNEARYGSNKKIYTRTPLGNVFKGNQYVNTVSLKSLGVRITKIFAPVGYGISAIEVGSGLIKDRGFGSETQRALGSVAGGMGGSALGAALGGTIGTAFGGVGAIPGAWFGGMIGGYFGGEAGKEAVNLLVK